MQNLKSRFNRKARRTQYSDFILLWIYLIILLELMRRLEQNPAPVNRPPFRPG
jgi:hypothetical protein